MGHRVRECIALVVRNGNCVGHALRPVATLVVGRGGLDVVGGSATTAGHQPGIARGGPLHHRRVFSGERASTRLHPLATRIYPRQAAAEVETTGPTDAIEETLELSIRETAKLAHEACPEVLTQSEGETAAREAGGIQAGDAAMPELAEFAL